MALSLPPMPPDTDRTVAPVPLRFEDITQDGRLPLEALPTALGPTIWQGLLARDPGVRTCAERGIVPILVRFVLQGTETPFSPSARLEAEGTCRVVRSEDGRFMLEMWADLYGPIGHAFAAGPRDGQRALAGRVFSENVFTRPFAPPGERRVTTLDFPGAPEVRATRPALLPLANIAAVPDGATALEPRSRPDAAAFTFGLSHTDSNGHVNSLVYLRLFEEAAIRRFVAVGRGASLLGRTIEIGYQKPCFAGQTVRVVERAFEVEGQPGVAATLVDEQDTANDESLARARPYAFARMTFG